jgi:hypothetical protein
MYFNNAQENAGVNTNLLWRELEGLSSNGEGDLWHGRKRVAINRGLTVWTGQTLTKLQDRINLNISKKKPNYISEAQTSSARSYACNIICIFTSTNSVGHCSI